jgi:hypothetical protein
MRGPALQVIDQDKMESFVVIAHRGDSECAPENTTCAFNLALMNGFAHFETDCQLTKDSTVVILHDEKLGRTNDGAGCAWDHTIEELKRLDAGSWFSEKYIGVRIPTLEELLDRYSQRAHIHLVRSAFASVTGALWDSPDLLESFQLLLRGTLNSEFDSVLQFLGTSCPF